MEQFIPFLKKIIPNIEDQKIIRDEFKKTFETESIEVIRQWILKEADFTKECSKKDFNDLLKETDSEISHFLFSLLNSETFNDKQKSHFANICKKIQSKKSSAFLKEDNENELVLRDDPSFELIDQTTDVYESFDLGEQTLQKQNMENNNEKLRILTNETEIESHNIAEGNQIISNTKNEEVSGPSAIEKSCGGTDMKSLTTQKILQGSKFAKIDSATKPEKINGEESPKIEEQNKENLTQNININADTSFAHPFPPDPSVILHIPEDQILSTSEDSQVDFIPALNMSASKIAINEEHNDAEEGKNVETEAQVSAQKERSSESVTGNGKILNNEEKIDVNPTENNDPECLEIESAEEKQSEKNDEKSSAVGKEISVREEIIPTIKQPFGTIFENFLDYNSEFKMVKIEFHYGVFKMIKDFIEVKEFQCLGLYGDFQKSLKITENYLGWSFQEGIQKTDFEGLFWIVLGSKAVLILKYESIIFNTFPVDNTSNFVTYLRFLIDLCNTIVFVPTEGLIFNEEKKTPFAKKINSEMEFQEVIVKPSESVELKEITQLVKNNQDFAGHFSSHHDFNRLVFKVASILHNKQEAIQNTWSKKFLYDDFLWDGYYYFQYETMRVKEVIRKIKKEWILKDSFFIKENSPEEFKLRILGLFTNAISKEDIEEFKNVIEQLQKKFNSTFKKYNDLYTKTVQEEIHSCFETLMNEYERYKISYKEALDLHNSGTSVSQVLFLDKLRYLQKNGWEELNITDYKLYSSYFYFTKENIKTIDKLQNNFSKYILKSKKEELEKLQKNKKDLRESIIKEFFEQTEKIIPEVRSFHEKWLTFSFSSIGIIRDTASLITNWNFSSMPMSLNMKRNFYSGEIFEVEKVLFIDNRNAFLLLYTGKKGKSLYHVSFLNKTESKPSLITNFPSSDSNFEINSDSRIFCIYNNEERRFDLGKINTSYRLDEGILLEIFDKTVDGALIDKIKSLSILSNSDKILFLNQNGQLIEYSYQAKTLKAIFKKENKGDEGVVSIPISPKNSEDNYSEIQSSPDGKIILLKSSTSIDIYDLTWSLIIEYQLKSDFKGFKVLTDQISNILIIFNRTSTECFEVSGIVASKTLNVTDLNKNKEDVKGNPIFDFIYHAFKKFGNHSDFLGSPDETNFIFYDENDSFKKRALISYFSLLKLDNSRLEYVNKEKKLLSRIKEANEISLNDFQSIVCSRVPIHLATVENYTLMPLRNGKSISDKLNNLFTVENNMNLVQQITDMVNFGIYEDVIKNISNSVYVIAICGRQSSGKSYVMNRFFGTRFGVAATRCTDGIWMSTAKILIEGESKDFIILDCEGLFSARRTENEEIKMCLVLSAISDIMILNQDLSFNRYLNQLFSNFSKSIGKLKSKRLFKGFLMMLIRDVSTSDSGGAYKELKSNLIQLERNKGKNFLGQLFGGKVVSRCLNYFEQEIFNDEIKDARQERFFKLNSGRWKNGSEFIESLKYTLTQIFIEDDSDMDVIRIKQRLENNIEICFKSFLDPKSQKMDIEDFECNCEIDSKEFKIKLLQKETIIDAQSEDSAEEQIRNLLQIFANTVGEKTEANHNEWVTQFKSITQTFFEQREKAVLDQFNSLAPTDSEFKENISSSFEKLKNMIRSITSGFKSCSKKCRTCERVCVFRKDHEKDCSCETSHKCGNICHKTPECIEKRFVCIELFGHQEDHCCIEGRHRCAEKCDIEDCGFTCNSEMNHAHTQKHDCGNKHFCKEKCAAEGCMKTCQFSLNNKHEKHSCELDKCMFQCHKCNKICSFNNHFHSELLASGDIEALKMTVDGTEHFMEKHLCDNCHDCEDLCEEEGICQVDFVQREAVWKNSFGSFNYIKYIPKESRLKCNKKTEKFCLNHHGIHKCDLNKPHRCNHQCPECLSFCNKEIGHEGLHSTNLHRNKKDSIFTSITGDNQIEFTTEGSVRKYEVGESCEPESCSSSCSRRGRAHYHLKECKGKDVCDAKINRFVKHSNKKFVSLEGKVFDLWLCKNFWNSEGWEMPVEGAVADNIPLCSFVCGHASHSTELSYCSNSAWHTEEHKFSCTHKGTDYSKIDIAFVCDTTGSMCSYIENSKTTIRRVMKEFASKSKIIENVQFGFVAYRDHPPQDSSYVTKSKNFTNEADVLKFVAGLDADGGGDGPEAVLDGLNEAVINLTWRSDSIKYLFHIADAPPHGKEYVSDGDGFPDGCPCGLKAEDIAVSFKSKNIKYKLLKIGSYANRMAEKFKEEFSDFEVSDLDHAPKMEEVVFEIIVKDMLANDLDFRAS